MLCAHTPVLPLAWGRLLGFHAALQYLWPGNSEHETAQTLPPEPIPPSAAGGSSPTWAAGTRAVAWPVIGRVLDRGGGAESITGAG